jgi:hypothetical protein
LLLGLHVTTDNSGERYRTFWIAPENGKVRVLSGPDLIVPGQTGFWRTCLAEKSEVDDGEYSESDVIVTEPATPSRAHCILAADSAEAGEQARRCTSSTRTRILFVGPHAISTENSWEGDCGAHPSSATDVELKSLTGRDSIAWLGLTDADTKRKLLGATGDAARAEFADFGTVDSDRPDTGDDIRARLSVRERWAVQRGAGYWHAIGQADCSPSVACGVEYTFPVRKFRVPVRLVGHDELFPSLESIRKAFPAVTDAVSSPRRDLVVALTGDSLLVFVVHDAMLGAPVAQLPVSGEIVMAQWATGRFVPVWTSKLRELIPDRDGH